MNNEQHALDAIEEETIPVGFVKTRDGQIIRREKAVFALRDATLNETGEKVLVGSRAVYRRDSETQQLTRVDKVKMSKAEKKAAKREKVKALKGGGQFGQAVEDQGRQVPTHRSGGSQRF